MVGLVEDGDLHAAELDGAALHEVGEPARGGDEDVDALVERLDLRLVGQAAGDELVAQAGDVDEGLERVAHLHGELAGRHEDERARALALRAGAVGEPGDHRQAEGEGLARAGAATAEDVAPGEGVGDRRRPGSGTGR